MQYSYMDARLLRGPEDVVLCGDRCFFQAEDGIRDLTVTGVQTCALPIYQKLFDDVVLPGADRFAHADLAGSFGDADQHDVHDADAGGQKRDHADHERAGADGVDRKSTRLNSSHSQLPYAVFCLITNEYTH